MIPVLDEKNEFFLPPPLISYEEAVLLSIQATEEDKSEEEAIARRSSVERKTNNSPQGLSIQTCRLIKIRHILKKIQQYHARFEMFRKMDLIFSEEDNELFNAFQAFVWDLRVYALRDPSTHEETQHLLECLQAVEAWLEAPFDSDVINDLEMFNQNHTLMDACGNTYQRLLQSIADHADEILVYLGIIGFFGVSVGASLLAAAATDHASGIHIAGKVLIGTGIGMMLTFCGGCASGCSDALEDRPAPKKYYLNHFGTFARAATRVYQQSDSSLYEFSAELGGFSP